MLRRTLRSFQQHHHHPGHHHHHQAMLHPAAAAHAAYYHGGSSGHSGAMAVKALADATRIYLRPPRNAVLNVVPEGNLMIVERFGRYHKTLTPGWWFLIPGVDRIRYMYSSKEHGVLLPQQTAVTRDNVTVEIDGVLFLRISDAVKASYNVENPVSTLINLAQTAMRSQIGRMSLDQLFEERAALNHQLLVNISAEATEWGVACKRYDIRDITVSDIVRQSMDLEAEAERRRRKLNVESDAEGQAEANRARGMKNAKEMLADAERYVTLQEATAKAEAMKIMAAASAASIDLVAGTLRTGAKDGTTELAMSLRLAERYVEAFGSMARTSNTVVVSQNMADPASLMASAMNVFKGISGTIPRFHHDDSASAAAGGGGGATTGGDGAATVSVTLVDHLTQGSTHAMPSGPSTLRCRPTDLLASLEARTYDFVKSSLPAEWHSRRLSLRLRGKDLFDSLASTSSKSFGGSSEDGDAGTNTRDAASGGRVWSPSSVRLLDLGVRDGDDIQAVFVPAAAAGSSSSTSSSSATTAAQQQ